jgi:HEAT repeat protein
MKQRVLLRWPMAVAVATMLIGCAQSPRVAFKELVDEDPEVRVDAAQRLGEAKSPEAVDSLIAILDDPSEMVRVQAVRSLGQIGDARAIPAIQERAKDELHTVRLQVSMSLGEFRDPAAIPTLKSLLYDPDESTRLAAARSLGKIGTDEAITGLIDVALLDEAEMIRQHVVRVIGERHMKEAIPIVEDALGAEADKVRAAAAQVLGDLGDASSLPALIRALDDPFYKTRSLAAHSLSGIAADDPEVRDALARRLEVEDHQMTQVDLAWAMARCGDRSELGIVRELLFTGDPEDVRAEAARALGDVGDQSDVPRLERAINDKKGLVRSEANEAVQKLKEA